MLLVLKKEQVEHARLRALATAILNKDKGGEAFDEYMKLAFPWVETAKKRQDAEQIKLLLEEVKKGALGITPLWEQKMRSRLKTRIIERDKSPLVPRPKEQQNRLYDRLGKTIPL